jgi:hypothetical protein
MEKKAANAAPLPWHVNFYERTTRITDSVTVGTTVDRGPGPSVS